MPREKRSLVRGAAIFWAWTAAVQDNMAAGGGRSLSHGRCRPHAGCRLLNAGPLTYGETNSTRARKNINRAKTIAIVRSFVARHVEVSAAGVFLEE